MSAVLTGQSVLVCNHGGRVKGVSVARVMICGAPVRVAVPDFPIEGCGVPFSPTSAGPCLRATMSSGGSTRVRVGGLLIMTAACSFANGGPGAAPVRVMGAGQTRVRAI